MDSPMSPLEAFKTTSMQCLSPQDKLKSSSLLAHRTAAAAAATASASATVKKEATPVLDASSIDFDTCWVSDDTLLRTSLDLDDCLTQDIDWVVDDSNNVSFTLGLLDDASASDGSVDNTSDDDDETVRDFGFGSASRTATTYLSPLQNELSLDSNESTDEDIVASSFDYSVLRLEPLATDAETLLMSFDTMHFPLPSPTSSSTNKSDKSDTSTKRRARLFTTTSTAAKRQRLATTTSLVHSSPVTSTNNSNNTEQMLDVLNLVVAPLQTATVSSVAATATSTNNNTKMIGAYNPDARRLRIAQFHAKRKRRTWKKSIKYDCRKKLADDRPRIKGRFVKVHDDCVVDCKVEPDGGEGGAMSPDSVVAFPPAIVATSPEAFVASASAVKEETTVETRSDSVRLAPAVAW